MSRLSHTAALAIGLAAFGAACATTILNVSSHVRPGIDIGQYRTFAWGPADALPTGDPRLDQNPYFQDYVQGAVEKQLAARGILASTTGTPDLLLHYHASIDTRIDVSRSEREYERCRARTARPGWSAMRRAHSCSTSSSTCEPVDLARLGAGQRGSVREPRPDGAESDRSGPANDGDVSAASGDAPPPAHGGGRP